MGFLLNHAHTLAVQLRACMVDFTQGCFRMAAVKNTIAHFEAEGKKERTRTTGSTPQYPTLPRGTTIHRVAQGPPQGAPAAPSHGACC